MMHDGEVLFPGATRLQARAVAVAERIDTRALERGEGEVLALAPFMQRVGHRGAAVVFRYGVVVLFETTAEEQAIFLEAIAPVLSNPAGKPEIDESSVMIVPDGEERVEPDGSLVLREASVERIKIVAEILAKSTALSHHEVQTAHVFERIEPLSQRLTSERPSGGSGRELQRLLGDVFSAQARTVGRLEVADKPEIVWDRPDLDRVYERLSTEFELRERDRVLTRKLEFLSSMAGTYLDLLQTRQTLRVEWYIVILILIEIVILVYEIVVAH